MKFALIGHPLGHSASPFIHEKLFKLNGIDASYVCHEVTPDTLDVKSIMREFDGINVTIPHKTAVIPALNRLCGKAEYLKTVNTIKKQDGGLFGYNTDADGFLKSLELSNITLSGRVLICGAGGTSRMFATLAAKHGCDVSIAVRPHGIDKAYALKSDIMNDFGAKINIFENDKVNGEFDLLLNGTPSGMYPKNIGTLPVSKNVISNCKAVFDAVYNPRMTELINTAKANGAKIAYGLPMLVYQAAKAQQIWLYVGFDDNEMKSVIFDTEEYILTKFK